MTDPRARKPRRCPHVLVAATVKVYAVPLVRPDTVQLSTVVLVQVFPPGLEVAVYPLIGAPPSKAGAVQDSTA